MASLLGFVLDTGATFMIMQKRYQYWSKDGIVWTDWFEWSGSKFPSPFKKLKVEYRDESQVY